MRSNGFRPSKALGQNFLTDDNITRKIVKKSDIDKSCGVLEVGPGYGALTKQLAQAAGHVTAVELDTRLIERLQEAIAGYRNVTVVHGDILKTDIPGLVRDTLPEPGHHVCANLPYSITTPVITRLIDAGMFEAITVMVQKEVAMRICAAPATPQYGAFTVFINYHARPEILFDIPPECFTPRPKVTSSVVRMVMHTEYMPAGAEKQMLFRVVRAAFAQRRKTLVNALSAAFGGARGKDAVIKAMAECGFDVKIRGETLSTGDFVKLSGQLSEFADDY